jgi:hypothetical protein
MKSAKLLLTAAGAAIVFCGAAHGESEKVKPYELKNRSSFRADADARIPFWPIGWKRPVIKPDGTTEVPLKAHKFEIEPDSFHVTSVLLGNPALATINGRSFEEGEVLPVMHGTERLRVVLRAIRDGGITLEYEGQQIQVPMKRPEVGLKRAEQKAEPAEFTINIGAPAKK